MNPGDQDQQHHLGLESAMKAKWALVVRNQLRLNLQLTGSEHLGNQTCTHTRFLVKAKGPSCGQPSEQCIGRQTNGRRVSCVVAGAGRQSRGCDTRTGRHRGVAGPRCRVSRLVR